MLSYRECLSIVDAASLFLPQLQGVRIDRVRLKGGEVRMEARTVISDPLTPSSVQGGLG